MQAGAKEARSQEPTRSLAPNQTLSPSLTARSEPILERPLEALECKPSLIRCESDPSGTHTLPHPSRWLLPLVLLVPAATCRSEVSPYRSLPSIAVAGKAIIRSLLTPVSRPAETKR